MQRVTDKLNGTGSHLGRVCACVCVWTASSLCIGGVFCGVVVVLWFFVNRPRLWSVWYTRGDRASNGA